jgi:hypothetical protein
MTALSLRSTVSNWVDRRVLLDDVSDVDMDDALLTCTDMNPFVDYQLPMVSDHLGLNAKLFGDYAVFDPCTSRFDDMSHAGQSVTLYSCSVDDSTSILVPLLSHQQSSVFNDATMDTTVYRNSLHRDESVDWTGISDVDFDDDWEWLEDEQKAIDASLAAHRVSISRVAL